MSSSESAGPPARKLLPQTADVRVQRLTLTASAVHRVAGYRDAACRFINVHAGGPYDFRAIAVEPP